MYIEKINSPQDVKALNTEEMKQLAQEMKARRAAKESK